MLSHSEVGGILQVLAAHPGSSASPPYSRHLSFFRLCKNCSLASEPHTVQDEVLPQRKGREHQHHVCLQEGDGR